MATTCLMCGALLEEEEAEPPPPEEKEPRQGLPGWARAIIVVLLAAAILVAGGYGLLKLMEATEEPTPTPTLTLTATSTNVPTPTLTPTITPTPSPLPPLSHQIRAGDTLGAIAEQYGTTVEAIMELNPGVEPETLQVGYVLLIPAGTLTPTPTPTLDPRLPTPTPSAFVTHVVAQGETLSTIAEQYGVSVALIREANDIPIGEDTIRVGQALVIPVGTPVPTATPTPDPRATPTPIPPYSPPPLLSPSDGAALVGSERPVLLQWASVGVLNDDEWYEINVYQPSSTVTDTTSSAISNMASSTISNTAYLRATAWRVPLDLLLETEGYSLRWWVQVVRERRVRGDELTYRAAGAPSEERSFIWQEATPTPTPTPTPIP
jgi:LysM repeat protein